MSLSCVDLSLVAQRLETLVEHFTGEYRFRPAVVPNGIHPVNDLPRGGLNLWSSEGEMRARARFFVAAKFRTPYRPGGFRPKGSH